MEGEGKKIGSEEMKNKENREVIAERRERRRWKVVEEGRIRSEEDGEEEGSGKIRVEK